MSVIHRDHFLLPTLFATFSIKCIGLGDFVDEAVKKKQVTKKLKASLSLSAKSCEFKEEMVRSIRDRHTSRIQGPMSEADAKGRLAERVNAFAMLWHNRCDDCHELRSTTCARLTTAFADETKSFRKVSQFPDAAKTILREVVANFRLFDEQFTTSPINDFEAESKVMKAYAKIVKAIVDIEAELGI